MRPGTFCVGHLFGASLDPERREACSSGADCDSRGPAQHLQGEATNGQGHDAGVFLAGLLCTACGLWMPSRLALASLCAKLGWGRLLDRGVWQSPTPSPAVSSAVTTVSSRGQLPSSACSSASSSASTTGPSWSAWTGRRASFERPV